MKGITIERFGAFVAFALLGHLGVMGQAASTFHNTDPSGPYVVPAGKPSSPRRPIANEERPFRKDEYELQTLKQRIQDALSFAPQQTIMSAKSEGMAAGIDPPIGVNFRGNQTIGGTPPDNSIAISNGGIIVSADNNSVDFYSELGDSLIRIKTDTLYMDSSITSILFDPNVEYDFNTDRFYLSYAHGNTSQLSKIALLVSKTNDPRDGWWEYFIPAIDSLQSGYWMDRPIMGHNNRYLYFGCTTSDDSGLGLVGNRIFQIEISSILSGGPMSYKSWLDVKDGNGLVAFQIMPASAGQVGGYGPDFYFISTERTGGDQVHLYHAFHNGQADTITATAINTSTYSFPLDADQLGFSDKLGTKDCRAQDAMYLNGKIHYVFHFNIGNYYSGISYNQIDLQGLAHTRDTWGLPGTFYYAYPALASYATDSTDESVMISFVRSGATIYPQACVVNYDGGWSPTTKIVKNGNGYVDTQPATVERWGDYTGICKRYNSLSPGVWMAAHYGFGQTPNQYGNSDTWSTWIAEIGDGHSVGQQDGHLSSIAQLLVHPNPVSETFNLTLVAAPAALRGNSLEVVIADLSGKVMFNTNMERNANGTASVSVSVRELGLAPGVYLISSPSRLFRDEKIMVVH